ncbi:hypothetical protein Ancab_018509 [Ancistrocladus abbreviatus]
MSHVAMLQPSKLLGARFPIHYISPLMGLCLFSEYGFTSAQRPIAQQSLFEGSATKWDKGLDLGDKASRVPFSGSAGKREAALPCLLHCSAFRSVPILRSSFSADVPGLGAQALALIGPRAADMCDPSCGKPIEAHHSEEWPTSPVSCPGLEAHDPTPSINHSDAGNGPSCEDRLGAQKSGGFSSSQGIIRGLALTCSGKQMRTRGKNRTMVDILQLRLSKRTLRQKGKKKKPGERCSGHARAHEEVIRSCSVESVRDSQFENRNKILRDGGESLDNKVHQIYPEGIWDVLSQLGMVDGQNKDREILCITEMESRDATIAN